MVLKNMKEVNKNGDTKSMLIVKITWYKFKWLKKVTIFTTTVDYFKSEIYTKNRDVKCEPKWSL